jgi:hypothetical protein
MNVYVETNFVLELALLQSEQDSCEHILSLCEGGRTRLIIPAYSLAEPNEPLIRRDTERKKLVPIVTPTLNQLSRSIPYQTEATSLQEQILSLLTRSGSEERQRFTTIRDRLLQIAEIIPLDGAILAAAVFYERQFGLSPQDSFVFASIVQHLKANPERSCFLTTNSRDFNDIDMRKLLEMRNCKLLFNFTDGYNYIQNQI